MHEQIDDSNFTFFAAKYYNNGKYFDVEDFEDDLNRIKNIRKLFKKYQKNKEINERLVLNHCIAFFNMFFPPYIGAKLLVFQLEDYLEYLKPFLEYLGYWQDCVYGIGDSNRIINTIDIVSDRNIVNRLQGI